MKLNPIILNDRIVPIYILQQDKHEIFRNHSEIVELNTAIIYHASYGRNSWHYTWTTLYDKHGFFTELEECKSWIETQRVQGSVWAITQLPALCMELANDLQLWLCSVNEDDWWDSAIFDTNAFISKINSQELKTLEIKQCVRSYEEMLSFVSDKIDNFEVLDVNKHCKAWKAISYGSYYKPGWTDRVPEIEHNYKGLGMNATLS
jgi:hypothetical protein